MSIDPAPGPPADQMLTEWSAQAAPGFHSGVEARQLAEMDAKARVPLPAGFAIAPHVLEAAARWPVDIDTTDPAGVDHFRCGQCHQSLGIAGTHQARDVPLVRRPGRPGAYQYTAEQLRGLVLAHLMQHHGWTREKTGG